MRETHQPEATEAEVLPAIIATISRPEAVAESPHHRLEEQRHVDDHAEQGAADQRSEADAHGEHVDAEEPQRDDGLDGPALAEQEDARERHPGQAEADDDR